MAGSSFTFTGGTVELENHNLRQMADLGLLSVPLAPDPIRDGYSNVILPAQNFAVTFQAERAAGAGSLDWDYVVLVPADEELLIVDTSEYSGAQVIDGANDIVYAGDLLTVHSPGSPLRVGSIPLVTPNQTNLYTAIRGFFINTLADTLTYTARYWPRYLYIR